MPLYKYLYVDDQGCGVTGEVGAQDIIKARETARLRMKETRELVLWDIDDPPPHVQEWLEEVLGKY